MPTCGVLVFSANEIGPHKTRLRHPTRSCRSVSLLHVFHINPPAQWIAGPFEMVALPDGTMAQGYGNVPAVIVVFLMPFQSTVGARGSDSGNGGEFRADVLVGLVELAAADRLAGDWPGDLLRLRALAQPSAAGRRRKHKVTAGDWHVEPPWLGD